MTGITGTIQAPSPAGAAMWRRGAIGLVLAVTLPAALGLSGCLGPADAAVAASGTAAAHASPPVIASVTAPLAAAERTGAWLGGPEMASGKLRSGITSWWRLPPAPPRPGRPFELLLRLEDVQAVGATVSVTTSDGARMASPSAPTQWVLQAGQPAQLRLKLVAPAGDSYLHVATKQRGRLSVRSVLLSLPAPSSASAALRGS